MISRMGPFIIMGLVRFTRWMAMEFFCIQMEISRTPGAADLERSALSFVAHNTAFFSSRA